MPVQWGEGAFDEILADTAVTSQVWRVAERVAQEAIASIPNGGTGGMAASVRLEAKQADHRQVVFVVADDPGALAFESATGVFARAARKEKR